MRTQTLNRLNTASETDRYLAELYIERIGTQEAELSNTLETVLSDLEKFAEIGFDGESSPVLVVAWNGVISICRDKIQRTAELIPTPLDSSKNASFYADREIDMTVATYLNLKFGKGPD